MEITKRDSFRGEIAVPGDKSISHRGIMLGAISEGLTEITDFLEGADCLSTISCFQKLGIEIERDGTHVLVHGKGLHGLSAPKGTLNVGNSGTTVRLISGILAGQPFSCVLDGDASIRKRPMRRIFTPLGEMGASFQCYDASSFPASREACESGCAPFAIRGGSLRGIHYRSPIASAQVKSAVLLAGLYADAETKVTEPALSRDHTERMLRGFGAEAESAGTTATIRPEPRLTGQKIRVPGDISSAAYFIALGLITPHSEILIRNVGVNPTRDGIIRAALAMGGRIKLQNERTVSGEPVADILVSSSSLHGIKVNGSLIPALIDEIPVLAVMAAYASGTTIIEDAHELRVKESDRIAVVTENLRAMGGNITPSDDGMTIEGGAPLHGARILTSHDHRIAMAFGVAGLNADGITTFDDEDCVTVSYPSFFQDIEKLSRGETAS